MIKLGKNKNADQGFHIIEVVLVLAVIGIIGFVGWRAWQHRKSDKPSPPSTAQIYSPDKNSQLCYIKNLAIECYKDSNLTQTTKPKVFEDLMVREVVPSPQDDKLALVTGQNGNFEIYTTDSKLKLTKAELKNFRKSDNSISWLKDGTGFVFEADNNAVPSSRIVVRYDLRTQQLTPLTATSDRSAEPQVANDIIAFWRYDLAANPNSAWRWHTMTTDGQNDVDLGINAGAFGVAKDGKLYVMGMDKKLIEIDLATRHQKTIATNLPFTNTASRASILDDGKLVAPYQSDSSNPGPFDRLGFVDLRTGTLTSVENQAVNEPFQTTLLNDR